MKTSLNYLVPNEYRHAKMLICTGGSCTGSRIIHSLTKGHKGINAILFEVDNNLLDLCLFWVTKWHTKPSEFSFVYIDFTISTQSENKLFIVKKKEVSVDS